MDDTNRPSLSEAELDRALSDAFDVQPSAEFRSRVRARVAAKSMAPGWHARALPLTLAATLVIGAGVAVLVRERLPPTSARLSATPVIPPQAQSPQSPQWPQAPPAQPAQTPTAPPARVQPRMVDPAVSVSAGVRARTSAPPHDRRPTSSSPARRGEPEVLVSPSEQAGIRLLFESAANGTLELPPDMLRDLSLPRVDLDGTTEGDNE